MEIRSQAIILNVSHLGEADLLVSFFSEEHGKLKGVAKNAKKSRKRFGGALEPGTIGVVRYIERANDGLVRLEEMKAEMPLWKIVVSLGRIANLHLAIELADKTLPPAQISKERFLLLARWIKFLSENEPGRPHTHAFLYKWLAASGLEPILERCAVCGKSDLLSHIVAFQGGSVCNDCYRPRYGGVEVSRSTLNYLCQLKAGRITELNSYIEADTVFNDLTQHACGCVLRSLQVAKLISNGLMKKYL